MEGYNNWGWKTGNKTFDDMIQEWYNEIFLGIIPNVISAYDPQRDYSSSSPMMGMSWANNNSYLAGDHHYWGVWAGNQSFEMFDVQFGRFTSEYGIQGMPCMNTIKKFAKDVDLSLNSTVMLLHERHVSRYEVL